MSLHPDREELMAWHDREVPAPRAMEISTHVDGCADCRSFTSSLAALNTRITQWKMPAPPATLTVSPPPATNTKPRRMLLWAAAAVVIIGVLTTVRVDCAPAPTCDRHTFRLSFMKSDRSAGMPEQARAMSPAEQAAFERYWLAKPLAVARPRPSGETARPVSVVIFLDWQCPACRAEYRAYAPVFADIQRRFPGKLTVAYQDYPLNKRCNKNVPVEMHPAACEAAVAVHLAKEHGTEVAMIEWLFNNQETLTPATVRQAAASIGKIPDFDERFGSLPMRVVIERSVVGAALMGVHSTPTCFVNGVLARGENDRLLSAGEIRLAIEIELRRLK